VTEVKKPAHRNASAKTLFTIEFTSPIRFRENAERGRTTDCGAGGIPRYG
jgi:hypothetical protein